MARGIGEQPSRSAGEIIRRIDYPATKRDFVEAAADEEAPADIINFFNSLPDRTYTDPDDVRRQFAEADARFGMWGAPDEDIHHRGDIGREMNEPAGGPTSHP